MPITAERLIRLLDGADDVDEWIATETRTRRVGRDVGARPARRSGDAVQLGAVIFRDSERGRGTARLWIDADAADDGVVRGLIARAVERAPLVIGPAWALPAPSAPARVVVADPDLLAEPAGVVDAVAAQLAVANGRLCTVAGARIEAAWRSHRTQTSRGLASSYQSTTIELDAAIGRPGATPGPLERVHARVRGAAQLFVHRRAADAARRAAERAAARPLEGGRVDLVLTPAALAGPRAELDPGDDPAGFGWFTPIVAHADGAWVRLGISRYRPGQSIFHPPVAGDEAAAGAAPAAVAGARLRSERAGPAGDPFTLASDGTLTLAPLSAPFSDLGEPVRRFDLVRAGASAGLALDYREAVLARATPNGGARNLVLAPGPTSAAILHEPREGRLVRIDELGWLDVDPRSGALTAGIGLGELRRAGARPVRVTGGLLVGNVFPLLERARMSTEVGALGWYRGPTAVRIDGVEIAGG